MPHTSLRPQKYPNNATPGIVDVSCFRNCIAARPGPLTNFVAFYCRTTQAFRIVCPCMVRAETGQHMCPIVLCYSVATCFVSALLRSSPSC
jgi:hypothetical protein